MFVILDAANREGTEPSRLTDWSEIHYERITYGHFSFGMAHNDSSFTHLMGGITSVMNFFYPVMNRFSFLKNIHLIIFYILISERKKLFYLF